MQKPHFAKRIEKPHNVKAFLKGPLRLNLYSTDSLMTSRPCSVMVKYENVLSKLNVYNYLNV